VKNKIKTTALFTVDVEEWYQPAVIERYVPRSLWPSQPLRLNHNLSIITDLLDEYDVKATFFTLSSLPKQHHILLRNLADKGHEIASHGHSHRSFTTLGLKEIEEELDISKKILEDITGKSVVGFRAPNFSITDDTVDLLVQKGYQYDSSVFSVRFHPAYGKLKRYPIKNKPYLIHPDLMEYPLSVLSLGPVQVPWAGGAYFRHFPSALFMSGVKNLMQSGYYHFYIHPWEFDANHPVPAKMKSIDHLRHFRNISRNRQMVAKMFDRFPFGSIAQQIEQQSKVNGHNLLEIFPAANNHPTQTMHHVEK
jgi:polysaccharide deacetylase family protein (PEP-CTERM system associated)